LEEFDPIIVTIFIELELPCRPPQALCFDFLDSKVTRIRISVLEENNRRNYEKI
jgi:hypothetical protein